MSKYIDFYLIGELVDSHGNVHYEDLKNLPTADVIEKEKWDRLLENSIILADAVQKYQLANAVKVKHGRWIEDRLCSTSGGTYGVRRCSVCEDYFQDVGYGWNYCPNCGAKMDERREDDTQN